jgi:CRP/FNR family transcriptional regulator, cyclic AMP receptor protein
MRADAIWGRISRLGRKKESLTQTLRDVPLFTELSTNELHVLEQVVHTRIYKPGETVFVETEPGAGMYVIQSGRVNIVLQHGPESAIPLAELEPGDFFGEMALLGNMTRSATAIATERSVLIGFFHPDLIEMIRLNPQIGAKISLGLAKTLADRLRYTSTQLRDVWIGRGPRETALR